VVVHRLRALLTGGILALGIVSAGVPAAADSVTILSIQTGHSVILAAAGLTRVAVGDGRIAGVVPIGSEQLVVNGKTPGHTTIFVWTGRGRLTYEVTVTEQSIDDIARIMRAAINEPDVQVVAFNTNIIVRGDVADEAAYGHLRDVLKNFNGLKVSGQNAFIVDAVTVKSPLGNLQGQLSSVPGARELRVDTDEKGNVIVSGNVHDAAGAQKALDEVSGLAGPYLATDGKVIDRIAVDTTSQVDVKVYVLEVDKTAQSQLGLRLQTATAGGGGSSSVLIGNISYGLSPTPTIVGVENPYAPTTFGGAFKLGNYARASLLAPTLDLLLTEGHAKILSSPDLVTLPGKEADFLVGGQIPIPVSNGLGTVTIEYKDYGVQLKVTPILLGDGSIDTKIAPEISDLDFADGINLNGFVVPAFKTSQLSTEVITQSGDSIVMGGLLRRVEQKSVQKIPLLADIPILGALFRDVSYQKQDTDVVFVMTPTVVTK